MLQRRAPLHALAAAILAAAGQAAVDPVIGGQWLGLHRGQQPINYRARAWRSHAGKPAGYVKAY